MSGHEEWAWDGGWRLIPRCFLLERNRNNDLPRNFAAWVFFWKWKKGTLVVQNFTSSCVVLCEWAFVRSLEIFPNVGSSRISEVWLVGVRSNGRVGCFRYRCLVCSVRLYQFSPPQQYKEITVFPHVLYLVEQNVLDFTLETFKVALMSWISFLMW